jgi:hypothetical protein
MRRAITLVVLVASLVSASTADAAGIHRFRVHDAGFHIAWGISICTKPGLQVQFKLRLEDFNGVVDTQNDGRPQPYRCTRTSWRWTDIYPEGEYCGRIKVRIPATGFVRYTQWRCFYIV